MYQDAMFYDMIFGASDGLSEELNTLEKETIRDVEDILDKPVQISSYIPSLPKVVIELISLLERDDHDFSKISEVIGRDVELTVKVVKVANSPYYLRSLASIQSLEHAVRSIGTAMASAIATTALMENTLRVPAIYFKWFGEVIWKHSLECAMGMEEGLELLGEHGLSKELAQELFALMESVNASF